MCILEGPLELLYTSSQAIDLELHAFIVCHNDCP